MLTLALCVLAAAPPFPEVLTRPVLAKAERFAWPPPKAFTDAWGTADRRAHLVLRLTLPGSLARWYLAEPPPEPELGRWMLVRLVGGDDVRFTDDELERDTVKTLTRKGEEVATIVARLEGTVPDELLAPATYVTTLLRSSGALYVDRPELRSGELRLLIKSFPSGETRQAAIEAWAQKNKGDDALFASFATVRPMGTCSMDTTPQDAARLYAELAFARGDLGKFLQLQLRIMGDQFERTAWSSYGEAAHTTEAARLASTGIDLDQFLLGLVVRTPGLEDGLDPWRLARSIREAGRAAALVPKLEALATSPALDAYNRLRATEVWFFVQDDLRFGRKKSREAQRAHDALLVRARKLSLHPLAVAWLDD